MLDKVKSLFLQATWSLEFLHHLVKSSILFCIAIFLEEAPLNFILMTKRKHIIHNFYCL